MFFHPVGGNGAAYTSKFKVNKSGVQSISSASWEVVEFDTAEYDGESEFDIVTNHRFTAKETGKYHLQASITIDGIVDGKSVGGTLRLNGTTTIAPDNKKQGNIGNLTVLPSTEIALTADDYVEVLIYNGDTVSRNTGTVSGCQFSGHRIG